MNHNSKERVKWYFMSREETQVYKINALAQARKPRSSENPSVLTASLLLKRDYLAQARITQSSKALSRLSEPTLAQARIPQSSEALSRLSEHTLAQASPREILGATLNLSLGQDPLAQARNIQLASIASFILGPLFWHEDDEGLDCEEDLAPDLGTVLMKTPTSQKQERKKTYQD
ncbi:hypothetical protein Lal_00038006 [Lupinus albus]|nr:hypothetical protein Lal_00038006 [Lupinus albus]